MLACLEHCKMTKCRRFFQCEEHWNADELAYMQPLPPAEEATIAQPVAQQHDHNEDRLAMAAGSAGNINHYEV